MYEKKDCSGNSNHYFNETDEKQAQANLRLCGWFHMHRVDYFWRYGPLESTSTDHFSTGAMSGVELNPYSNRIRKGSHKELNRDLDLYSRQIRSKSFAPEREVHSKLTKSEEGKHGEGNPYQRVNRRKSEYSASILGTKKESTENVVNSSKAELITSCKMNSMKLQFIEEKTNEIIDHNLDLKASVNADTHSIASDDFDPMKEETCSNILVSLRVRPLREETECIQTSCNDVILHADDNNLAMSQPRCFSFDHVFDKNCTQQDIARKLGIPLVDQVLRGYNSTIMVYGQTGSGKTYTMFGEENEPALMLLTIHDLFEKSVQLQGDINITATLIEDYQDNLVDLLQDNPQEPRLLIRQKKNSVELENAMILECNTMEQVQAIMKAGKKRVIGCTNMNKASSRSHVILTLYITRSIMGKSSRGKFHFIDLAGSERSKSTGTQGESLREGSNINLSLSALGNCVDALSNKQRTHVPYRNSKLTRILQDSIGGNSMTCMICTVSPASINRGETLSTLRFAMRAKKVENKVKMNISTVGLAAQVDQLRYQNRLMVAALKNMPGGDLIVQNIFMDPSLKSSLVDENCSIDSQPYLEIESKTLEVKKELFHVPKLEIAAPRELSPKKRRKSRRRSDDNKCTIM